METLNEVIDAMERCSKPHYFDCKGCPYEDDDAEVGCRSDDRDADVLQYLKAYRDDRDDLSALRAFWAEQQGNDPLTWSELRQMEGKPVYVVYHTMRTKGWALVDYVDDDRIDFTTPSAMRLTVFERQMGKTWQAYRKERS